MTCLEKIDAIAGRFERGKAAGDFVRHYEDVARILRARERLPELENGLQNLLVELANTDRTQMPSCEHASLNPSDSERWQGVKQAWEAIAPLFWGERISLDDACVEIRAFLNEGA